jgi:cyclase
VHKIRVIPVLLLRRWGIEKSIRFKKYVYVGSPINAARVFNGRNVDELILLDIAASAEGRGPDLQIVSEITGESQMPLTVGGGIRDVETIRALLNRGVDRVALNTHALARPALIREAADQFGSQCIVVSIDVKRRWNGRETVVGQGGRRNAGRDPVAWAQEAAGLGAGEILLTSVDRDGTMDGYDIDLVRRVSEAVPIPVIACGGAGRVEDFAEAVDRGGASAVAAGAFFLFFGPRRTVLINYPTDAELARVLGPARVRMKDPEFRPPARP